jgi:nitroimidazol reductase NimA-like FMN-containing flavoprotein (pyridoxamine 5'-phosphate oxidase superfamily)
MSLVKLPRMSSTEIEELLDSQFMCRIAFNGGEYPYLAPFRYVRIDGSLYFHFTDYGKKMRLIEQDDKACVQIESYAPDLSNYNFVSLRGHLVKVDDLDEVKQVVSLFTETGKKSISPKFLAAHGFNPDEGWSAFKGDDLVIIKLVDVVEKVGLKSPD